MFLDCRSISSSLSSFDVVYILESPISFESSNIVASLFCGKIDLIFVAFWFSKFLYFPFKLFFSLKQHQTGKQNARKETGFSWKDWFNFNKLLVGHVSMVAQWVELQPRQLRVPGFLLCACMSYCLWGVLHVRMGFLHILLFPFASRKYSSEYIGYTKLTTGVNICLCDALWWPRPWILEDISK